MKNFPSIMFESAEDRIRRGVLQQLLRQPDRARAGARRDRAPGSEFARKQARTTTIAMRMRSARNRRRSFRTL